ncbi:MAG TPA: hypothetical protein VIR30_21755 [Nocardioides sp.]
MNPKRLLAAVAGAAMLSPIPIAMTTTAAEAATTVDTRVVINKTSSVYTYKTAITISGQVQGKHPENGWGPVADTAGKVALYRKVAPYSSWKWVASDSTEASFSFRTLAYANTTYRVVYTGGSTDSWTFPATSNWRAIKARRDSGAKIVKSSSGRLYMQGNVDPGWANKSVKIVRSNYARGTYKTYKWVTTNKYGAYKASVAAPRSGRYYYRVIIAASSPVFVQTTSPTWYTYKSY